MGKCKIDLKNNYNLLDLNSKIINLGNSLSYINTFLNETINNNIFKFKFTFNDHSEIFISTFLPLSFNSD